MIENSKLTDRCLHCGKKREKGFGAYCSKECQETMEKKMREWEEKDLCIWGCGKPVYVSKIDGKKYRACFECLTEMTLAFREMDKLLDIAKGEKKDGK